ncbi:hypothetical protein MYX07_00420 [Patescibacteria group bacterium AH-259-L07]|nr:hypothetical protein [Patescibacteria group bacterium AH-259-L07]
MPQHEIQPITEIEPLEELPFEQRKPIDPEQIKTLYRAYLGEEYNPVTAETPGGWADIIRHHIEKRTPEAELISFLGAHPQTMERRKKIGTIQAGAAAGASSADIAAYLQSLKTPFSEEEVVKRLREELGVLPLEKAVFEPEKTAEQIYLDIFQERMKDESVVAAKQEISKVDKQIADRREALSIELREIEDNPWLTETGRSKRFRKKQTEAMEDINNFINQRKQFESVVDFALTEAERSAQQQSAIYMGEIGRSKEYLEYLQKRIGEEVGREREGFEAERLRRGVEFTPEIWKEQARLAGEEEKRKLEKEEGKEKRDHIRKLQQKYPDVGILETDTPEMIAGKIKKSGVFRKEIYIKPPKEERITDGLSDRDRAKQFLTDNPDASDDELFNAIRENTKLSITDSRSLIKTREKPQFLDSAYIYGLYTREELENKVKDAGYNKLLLTRDQEIQNYINDLMNYVKRYRDAGYSDKEIEGWLDSIHEEKLK